MNRTLLLFFLVYLVALTFPAVALFNRIEPFILGFPFVFAWYVLWVLLGWALLIWVHLSRGAGS